MSSPLESKTSAFYLAGAGHVTDQDPLPVPEKLQVFDRERAQLDAHLVQNLTALALLFAARIELFVCRAQGGYRASLLGKVCTTPAVA